jgi:hypothetical protein
LNGSSKIAFSPSSCSISSSRLYFAMRSPRQGAPAFIKPPFIATAKSAIKESVVSPDRWEIIYFQPADRHRSTAWIVSVTVPIWLSLMSAEFVVCSAIPRRRYFGLVEYRSSPMTKNRLPISCVCLRNASQDASENPSSIRMTGNRAHQSRHIPKDHFLRDFLYGMKARRTNCLDKRKMRRDPAQSICRGRVRIDLTGSFCTRRNVRTRFGREFLSWRRRGLVRSRS